MPGRETLVIISHLGGINTSTEKTLGCLALVMAVEKEKVRSSEKDSPGFAGC